MSVCANRFLQLLLGILLEYFFVLSLVISDDQLLLDLFANSFTTEISQLIVVILALTIQAEYNHREASGVETANTKFPNLETIERRLAKHSTKLNPQINFDIYLLVMLPRNPPPTTYRLPAQLRQQGDAVRRNTHTQTHSRYNEKNERRRVREFVLLDIYLAVWWPIPINNSHEEPPSLLNHAGAQSTKS